MERWEPTNQNERSAELIKGDIFALVLANGESATAFHKDHVERVEAAVDGNILYRLTDTDLLIDISADEFGVSVRIIKDEADD